METYYIIYYEYLTIKKQPNFQFWVSGTHEVIFDHDLAKMPEVPRDMYTKSFLRARTLIKGKDLSKINTAMSKHFTEFNIYHSETIELSDTIGFNHMMFPNFQNKTKI